MSKGATGTSRCGIINYEDWTTPESVRASPRCTTSCSRVLTARLRRSDFSGRSPGQCLPRYWSPSRYRLLPSVHRDAPWARLKGYRVADAVIEAANSSMPTHVGSRRLRVSHWVWAWRYSNLSTTRYPICCVRLTSWIELPRHG